jgi:glutamate--cysteine ligase
MARDTTDFSPIESKDELVGYLAAGNKPKDKWRIGTEHEKFPFYVDGNAPVPYGGDRGIRAILEGMQTKLGWDPILDAGRIIGLVEPTGQGAISLEPGGQFELSGAPLETIHQTCREGNAHLAQVREIAEPLGIRFPRPRRQPQMDAGRDAQNAEVALRDHDALHAEGRHEGPRHDVPHLHHPGEPRLLVRGRHAPQDAGVAEAAAAVDRAVRQLALHRGAKPNGLQSWRGDIWRDTDNQRSGLLDICFSSDFGFADYVEWALDVPMYFVIRDGVYHDMTHMTFRQFLDGKARNEVPDGLATMGDWANHLSTLFPDVRLKRFLEMRGADGGPWRRICALPAFWVGLLYDDEALDAAETLTSSWTYEEVRAMRDAVPVEGISAVFRNRTLRELGREVLSISRGGLKRRNRLNRDGFDETHFLSTLDEVIARGTTSAEEMLNAYHTRWDGSIEPVFTEYAY